MSVQIRTHTNVAGEVKEYAYPNNGYRDASLSNFNDKRRTKDTPRSPVHISKMWENHHEIARRIVLGQNNKSIAEDLGCTAQTVSNVRNSPVVKEKISLMNAARDGGTIDLAKEIADLAPLAIERIKEVLTSGSTLGKEASASVILKEANGLLDREMGRAVQRVDTRGVHAHLTMEDIQKIKDRAYELTSIRSE